LTIQPLIGPIALLGTSADPPTNGHKILLEGLLKIFPSVVTWASDNPLKIHGASLSQRYALLNALVKTIDNPNLQLIQDLSHPLTIRTLETANEIWPTQQLVFVIGSDLVQELPKWEEVQSILNKARIGIAPRKGWPIKQDQLETLKVAGGKIDLLSIEVPATSSTAVRKDTQFTQIPESVLKMVLSQNLYGVIEHPK